MNRRPEDKAALQAALDAVKGVEACARAAAKFIQDTINLTAVETERKNNRTIKDETMTTAELQTKILKYEAHDESDSVRDILYLIVEKMDDIEKRLEAADLTARRAAREASCLANGIQPD